MLFLKQNFKIYNITLNLDPNWAKSLDPDPNSMYLDPQHCFQKDLRCRLLATHFYFIFN